MSAVLSACGRYRYRLQRGDGPRRLAFVMLNPSTADADVDDPTIRRCRAFALREGYNGIDVANLFALRATDPTELSRADDPFGPENAAHLRMVAADHRQGWILCAWGALKSGAESKRLERATAALLGAFGARLVCLGTTKDGSPRHPLYVRGDAAIADWTPPA
jgi:hypothetical protein